MDSRELPFIACWLRSMRIPRCAGVGLNSGFRGTLAMCTGGGSSPGTKAFKPMVLQVAGEKNEHLARGLPGGTLPRVPPMPTPWLLGLWEEQHRIRGCGAPSGQHQPHRHTLLLMPKMSLWQASLRSSRPADPRVFCAFAQDFLSFSAEALSPKNPSSPGKPDERSP